MGRRHEVVDLLKQGLSPTEIISTLKLNPNTIFPYLFWGVGAGLIRRSDVVFSYDPETRNTIESIIQKTNSVNKYNILKEAQKENLFLNRETVEGYLNFRDAKFVWGDMYEYIREIEIDLHKFIKNSLILKYGDEGWWRNGVPTGIRKDCVGSYEEDDEPASEPFCYTTFIQLGRIMEDQWNIFKEKLPSQLSSNRKQLLLDLGRLNRIRNSVMHPVKDVKLTEQDFDFVRSYRNIF
jgi:hypothetical protein